MKIPKSKGRKVIKKTKKPKINFEKKVQKVIDKNNETKQSYQSVNDVNYNSGISAVGDAVALIPPMNKGTNDNQRVGDDIVLKSFNVRGHMLINITSPVYSSSRICIRLMVIMPKMYRSRLGVLDNFAVWSGTLLKKGGTTGAFTGAVSDLYAPINTNNFIVYYDKKFYMSAPYAPISLTGNVITDPGAICKFFNINFKIKNKPLKYDDSIDSGLSPTSFNPFLLLGYSKLDNGAPDTLSTAVNLNFTSLYNFQDS